ncbi:MAG TPA: alpha-isopropylmalate synthase regulatory domain-containing protein [Tepidisphaeraceae bacterium]|nr:alpha-isopropylmalate synthase regulatory domain-containing protein [Tepidisphaeraceae bacterium]
MHVHAIQKDTSTYEHIPPESVGNSRKVLVSELSGVSNIATKAGRKFNLESDKAVLRKVLEKVQDLENIGYHFESAEASFELLVRKQIHRHKRFFDLDHYRVVILRQANDSPVAEATIKCTVHGAGGSHVPEHRVAEGDGPVDALNSALRRALKNHHPAISDVHLVDYKVRVINSREETGAAVRVVIECKRTRKDGSKEHFGTIGVDRNIIDASWQALVDAYEYHLLHVEEGE